MRDNEIPLLTPLFRNLTDEENLDSLRWSIFALIHQEIERRGEELGEWDTFHLNNAITMLAMNVESLAQPTFAWLRLCLVDLEHALTPVAERSAISPAKGRGERALGLRELTGALAAVENRIERRQRHAAVHGALLRRAQDLVPVWPRLNFS